MILRTLASLVLLTVMATAADEITIPLEGGSIVLRDMDLIQRGIVGQHLFPELQFTVINQTSDRWDKLILNFTIKGSCNGEPREWSENVSLSLDWMASGPLPSHRSQLLYSLQDKMDGCLADNFAAKLLLAQNSKVRIDLVTNERLDYEEARREAAAKRARQQALEVKRKAAGNARKKRLVEEEERRAAERRLKVRLVCQLLYTVTHDKKIADLTVEEEQKVRACQLLGLYPPPE